MSTGYASPVPAQSTSPSSPGAKLAFHLQNRHTQHMDGRQTEYPQSGLSSPFNAYREQDSEDNSADQASAAQYPQGQDPRGANFSSSATPTSEYGIPPSSARSGSFPEYIQRQQHYTPAGQGAPVGGMAQSQSPSQSGPDGHASSHNSNNMRSDADVPIDPSIAAASPTYPPQHQYSPYQPQHEMSHYPAAHPGVYGRPDWASPGQYQQPSPHMPHYGHSASTGPPTPGMVSPVQRPPTGGHPLSTVYSFVPIPGAQQHKRPRRRYEEIERMYKCGWNGCEKAYGTLNHLNAHVTMQSHGSKRTPEEFKEIRKEWKAKKKEEEQARKAEDERQRQSEGRAPPEQHDQSTPVYGNMRTPLGPPPSMGGPQLPPIGYQSGAGGQSQPQYGQPSPAMEGMGQYATVSTQLYTNGNNTGSSYPQSPRRKVHQLPAID
ncbi:c2h2 transcription factor [Venturia nashicola]|uniref:C2h2 transcription factor n=1 Tax=Venturia nashicola TaxID=86259 RepID=A0A4Z1P8B0_9PEZI|nr:c2h2 transcription factor [Venturia nashicola]TLD37650.1 c2h2 transcription factor [Venturia nashicola]